MLKTLAHSAVAGFGASAGRDAYRKSKDAWLLVIIIATLFFFVFVYRAVARNAGARLPGSGARALFGAFGLVGLNLMFGALLANNQELVSIPIIVVNAVSAAAGIPWGLAARAKDRREYTTNINQERIEEENMHFMKSVGLRDSEFDRDVLEDNQGNMLRVKEIRDDAIVLTVLRRRNLRAVISLEDGRMTAYSGIVKL